MRSRFRLIVPLLILSSIGGGNAAVGASAEMADRVVVRKTERKLLLMKDSRVLRSYDVALGLSPRGHKQREGDFRTPEGSYQLSGRKLDSDFFLAIQVSYPNAADERRARGAGLSPGGQIMIHGQPNRPTRPLQYYRSRDWTNGCIAVSNSAMVDIWLMTPDGIPIEILP
jgi:murein L,D-transpeptidase YafK